MLAWLTANWKEVLLIVLTVDSALIPIFPAAGFLGVIKDFLTLITGGASAQVKK